jgi:hypothetical protein
MEMPVFKCPSCQASVKYAKDKGGKRSKCPKCGTAFTLPKVGDNGEPQEHDDDGGHYGVAFVDDDAEREKRETALAKKGGPKKPTQRIRVRRKNIGDLDAWRKVYHGLLFLMIGACVWGGAYGLKMLVIFLGLIQGPEFGPNAALHLMPEDQAAIPGVRPDIDRASFFLSLLSGTDFFGTGRALMIISQILMFVVAALWMTGYGLSLPIENRMGTRGQLIFMFILSGTNLLLNIFLWLLPIVGAIRYVMVPYFAPEIVTHQVNTERVVPLHVQWSAIPTLEIILTLVVHAVNLLEPLMIGIFIWTIACMLRDDPMAQRALGYIKLGFGVLFIILVYHMYAVAGSSSVLLIFLRVIYVVWFAFQTGMIVKLATTCHAARELLWFYLNPDD